MRFTPQVLSILLWMLGCPIALPFRRVPIKNKIAVGGSSTARRLFDHFIDCKAYPDIAALYGGPSSSACLGGQSGLSFLFTGGIAQLATFAVLLASYYAFKRGTNLFDIGEDTSSEASVGRDADIDRTGDSKCPKCNGSGVFSWGREGLVECDLCEGSGRIDLSGVSGGGARPSLQLPRRARRDSWLDEVDEDDDN